jgi:hypothetical protein
MQFIFSRRVTNARDALVLRPVPVVGLVVTVLTAALLIGLAGVGGVGLGS